MKYLVDTDYVIDYLYGNQDARDLLAQLNPDGMALSVITYSEIYEGIFSSREPKQAERVFRAFLEGVTVLPLGREVGRQYARLRRELRAARRPITNRALDLVIAATAITHRLVLVTRNTRDYGDVPALHLYDRSATLDQAGFRYTVLGVGGKRG